MKLRTLSVGSVAQLNKASNGFRAPENPKIEENLITGKVIKKYGVNVFTS